MGSSSLPSRPESQRRALVAVAALGLVTACGSGGVPGVTVNNAQTDVVFGNPAVGAAPVTPPSNGNFVPQGPGIGFPSPPTLPGLTFNHQPPQFPVDNQPPVRSSFCPGPPLFATAPAAATTSVQDQPKPGFYLWQLLRAEELAEKVVVKTAKYTNYEISNVSAITSTPNPQGPPTTVFTFDQVMPIGGGSTLTITYQVKQNAPGANVGQVQNVGTPRRVSEPDAGVAIKAEVQRDASGKETGSFKPAVAVLILPLPVVGGAQFTGAGSDAKGGSMQVQGTVKGVDRVAGCNDYVQGYRVDATVTSSGANGQAGPNVAQTYIIETQSGGLVIGNTQTPTGSKVTTSSIAGDITPAKKPKSIPKDLQP